MHNIKPEMIPKILAILEENPKQCTGEICSEPGCYCFEGLLAEIARREQPDVYRWEERNGSLCFDKNSQILVSDILGDDPHDQILLKSICAMFTTDGDSPMFEVDGGLIHAYRANDGYDWTWDDFKKALTVE